MKKEPKKILVFSFSDNSDYYNVIFNHLSGVEQWIKADVETRSEHELKELEYTITPVLMTRKELKELPEAE